MTAVDRPGAARLRLRAAAGQAKPLVRRAWRRALIAKGRDRTAESAQRSCLVLAPHPDDETLGCGATIARKRAAGTPVRVVVATDGRFSHRSERITPDELAGIRADEARAACAALGVAPEALVQYGYPEQTLQDNLDEVVQRLRQEIAEFRPDEVLVTSELDWHPDHRALNRALRLALSGNDAAVEAAAYPVWLWADGPWLSRPPQPAWRAAWNLARDPLWTWRVLTPRLVATDGHLEAKRAALAAYRSQTTNLTGEAGWATMDAAFLDQFLGPAELSFPVPDLRRGPR